MAKRPPPPPLTLPVPPMLRGPPPPPEPIAPPLDIDAVEVAVIGTLVAAVSGIDAMGGASVDASAATAALAAVDARRRRTGVSRFNVPSEADVASIAIPHITEPRERERWVRGLMVVGLWPQRPLVFGFVERVAAIWGISHRAVEFYSTTASKQLAVDPAQIAQERAGIAMRARALGEEARSLARPDMRTALEALLVEAKFLGIPHDDAAAPVREAPQINIILSPDVAEVTARE